MTAKQENKLSMFLAVKAVCDRNTATIQTLQAFADGYTEFTTRVANIQTLAQNQSVDATGLAADKQQLRKTMADAAAVIALAVNAYAKKVKNNDLAAQSAVTASDMTSGRDTAAADTARNVHAAATANLANLAAYGVTCCDRWVALGYKDSTRDKIIALVEPDPDDLPGWWGLERLHLSHRSNLLRKDPVFYGPLFPDTPADLDYVWPEGAVS